MNRRSFLGSLIAAAFMPGQVLPQPARIPPVASMRFYEAPAIWSTYRYEGPVAFARSTDWDDWDEEPLALAAQ